MFSIQSGLIQSGYTYSARKLNNNINCWRVQMFINIDKSNNIVRPYKVTDLLSYLLPISSFKF